MCSSIFQLILVRAVGWKNVTLKMMVVKKTGRHVVGSSCWLGWSSVCAKIAWIRLGGSRAPLKIQSSSQYGVTRKKLSLTYKLYAALKFFTRALPCLALPCFETLIFRGALYNQTPFQYSSAGIYVVATCLNSIKYCIFSCIKFWMYRDAQIWILNRR